MDFDAVTVKIAPEASQDALRVREVAAWLRTQAAWLEAHSDDLSADGVRLRLTWGG